MVVGLSFECDSIVVRNKKGKERNSIHLDDVAGVELGAPKVKKWSSMTGSFLPGKLVTGRFKSDIGVVWCDYGKDREAITIRMEEGSKYDGYVYGVSDPKTTYSLLSAALAKKGSGGKKELLEQKTDDEKLRDLIEDSKYD